MAERRVTISDNREINERNWCTKEHHGKKKKLEKKQEEEEEREKK